MAKGTNELIRERMGELEYEKKRILKKSAPLRAKRDKVQEEINELKEREKELTQQIREIEDPTISEISTELAEVARVLGAKARTRAGVQ